MESPCSRCSYKGNTDRLKIVIQELLLELNQLQKEHSTLLTQILPDFTIYHTANPDVCKWTTPKAPFAKKARIFYDCDKKETFVVRPEQWEVARRNFETANIKYQTAKEHHVILQAPLFIIETGTGEHYNWIYREDENYDNI